MLQHHLSRPLCRSAGRCTAEIADRSGVEGGQLRTMGFTNDSLSVKALKKAGGVVETAHAALAAFSAHKADALTAKAAKQQQRLTKLQV